jgi:hypothetical protein
MPYSLFRSLACPGVMTAALFLMPSLEAQVELRGIARSGSTVTLQVLAPAGLSCRVEASGSLAAGSWSDVGDAFAGTGSVQAVVLPGAASPARRFFRVVWTVPAPAGFKFIPEGPFLMGDQSAAPKDGVSNELPVIEVTLPGFFMKTTEVTLDVPVRHDDVLIELLGRALGELGPERAAELAEEVGIAYGESMAGTLGDNATKSFRAALHTVADALSAHGFAAHAEKEGS